MLSGVQKKTLAQLPRFAPTSKAKSFPNYGPGQTLFQRESTVLEPLVQEILNPPIQNDEIVTSHYLRGPPGSGKVVFSLSIQTPLFFQNKYLINDQSVNFLLDCAS